MARSEKRGAVVGAVGAAHRGRTADESLASALAEASVEVDELCAEHGITPELLETRQAIDSAAAALADFVNGERAVVNEQEEDPGAGRRAVPR